MSSSLCFLCHSTVNSETSEEIHDKFKEVVGMHLCPHLCHICCHMIRKLYLFRATCLKRSLEYPVLFSEKGTLNVQKSELESIVICNEDDCQSSEFPRHQLYSNCNSKTFHFIEESFDDDHNRFDDRAPENNQYVDLVEHDRNNIESVDNNFTDEEQRIDVKNYAGVIKVEFEANCNNEEQFENQEEYSDDFREEISMSPDQVDEIFGDMEPTDDYQQEIDQAEDTTQTQEDDSSSKKRHKKQKKKSYEKIELTFKEQKAALEAQRKEKKYLESMFKCHSCALGFLFQDTYQSHMVRHEESNGQFKCGVCGLRFATRNARAMHVNLHADIYRCNKCGVQVKGPHRRRHSRDCWHVVETASCHLCGKQFKDGNCLQQHLRRFHAAKSSSRVHPCSVCGKTYPEPGGLRTHMIKHINCRFPCTECPASFTSPYSLNRHKRSHAAESRDAAHRCDLCDATFDTRKGLAAHLKNTLKHQQRSFECAQCARKFPTKHALTRHAETHAKAVHYCGQCGAACRGRGSLQRHERAHRARAPLSVCHICGKGFKCKSKLNRHVKEVCEKAKLEEELAAFYEQESVLEQIHTVVGT